MAERRKGRKKREDELKNEEDKPSKAEYAVSKYLRSKLPEKKTTLLSHKVSYFISSKAIDCLLESPWSTGKEKGKEVLFTSREAVIKFLDMMLRHKFFHRARKIVVQKEKKKKKEEEEEVKEVKDVKKRLKIKDKEEKTEDKAKKEVVETEKKKGEETEKKKGEEVEKKKEKKKFKLDMHLEQIFADGNEVYVWIYDPIPVRAWIIGTLMVVGAVAVCLFPLWPKTVRHYVYYLSVAAAGFLVFIIALAVIRLVVFVLVWLVTFGKHHLWLLPNLTEDVGFFDSFWPLYKYEFKGGEEEEEEKGGEVDKDNKEMEVVKELEGSKDAAVGESEEEEEPGGGSRSESEKDEGSREGSKNGDNGFEILEPDENYPEEEGQPS